MRAIPTCEALDTLAVALTYETLVLFCGFWRSTSPECSAPQFTGPTKRFRNGCCSLWQAVVAVLAHFYISLLVFGAVVVGQEGLSWGGDA